jgi:Domain of unknown function (DUF397)
MEHIEGLNWRTSSYSGGNGGACVEVAGHEGMILVRDSKDHSVGHVHRFPAAGWRMFVVGLRNREFDRTEQGPVPSAVSFREPGR